MRLFKILIVLMLAAGTLSVFKSSASASSLFTSDYDFTSDLKQSDLLAEGTYARDDMPGQKSVIKREGDHYRFYPTPQDPTGYPFSLYALPIGTLQLVRFTFPENDPHTFYLFVEISSDGQSWTFTDLPPEGYATLPTSLKQLLTTTDDGKSYRLTPTQRAASYFLRNITQPGYLSVFETHTRIP